MPKIAVVAGSTRPTRIVRSICDWVTPHLQTPSLSTEVLDLADWPLPLLDEPLMASLGEYRHPHTQAWRDEVLRFEGFLFVFPQYNWGYPAVLKNALDYLYAEWRNKPATVMTYGTRGGGKGATQLLQVLNGLHMDVLPHHIEASIGADALTPERALADVDAVLAPTLPQIKDVINDFEAAFAAK